MARCTIIDAGFNTTVQDLGRLTARDYGVPHSGAMDLQSAAQANKAVGNPPETPVLEMTMTGVTIVFSEPTSVAVTGARCDLFQNDNPLKSPCVLSIKTGDMLRMGALQDGNYSYLAIVGGFQTGRYLGSASYYPQLLDEALVKKGSFFMYESVTNKVTKTLKTSSKF